MKQLPSSFVKEHELQKNADVALRETWLNDILFTWQWSVKDYKFLDCLFDTWKKKTV